MSEAVVRQISRATCETCEGPGKVVWPASGARPHLYRVEQNGWFDLVVCQDCGTLWAQSPYEPYASFIYLISWPYSRAFWSYIVDLQDGLVISRWCAYKIREAWPTMSEQDRLAIANHRTRSYGRNPIDEAPDGADTDPFAPFLVTSVSNSAEA